MGCRGALRRSTPGTRPGADGDIQYDRRACCPWDVGDVLRAIGWGSLAASSLVIGAAVAFARDWSPRQVAVVLAFGAGALISAVSFELAEEGLKVGGLGWTWLGLALGAITYWTVDGALERWIGTGAGGGDAGIALALGAFLDGIPEQLVLGIGLASGASVGLGLLVAIFVSNLPEAIGSARDMHAGGTGRRRILLLWTAVAACCAASTVLGDLAAGAATGEVRGAIDGFAAGALIVMLIDSMIPEARAGGGRVAGLIATFGFAVAAALSTAS
jgi:ZIP family zinc transporter